MPHFSVKDISCINPQKLKEKGIRGIIFDKDNTLTAPFEINIHPSIVHSFEEYKRIFGIQNIVILSNSAGTNDDKEYYEARLIEEKLGIKVLLHKKKKPFGINCVKDYFGDDLCKIAMFGDRLFTDIVFGNRYGMLTIHTKFLTESGDNKIAAKIRKKELSFLERLIKKGITPPSHILYCPTIEKSN